MLHWTCAPPQQSQSCTDFLNHQQPACSGQRQTDQSCTPDLAGEDPNDRRLGRPHKEVVQAHGAEQAVRPGQGGVAVDDEGRALQPPPRVSQRDACMVCWGDVRPHAWACWGLQVFNGTQAAGMRACSAGKRGCHAGICDAGSMSAPSAIQAGKLALLEASAATATHVSFCRGQPFCLHRLSPAVYICHAHNTPAHC